MNPSTRTATGHLDRGSIPLALLVIITLSGVIGALVVTTVGSTRAARFDQQYTETIQSADTGALEGASYMIRVISDENKRDAVLGATFNGSGTADGIPYAWEAEKISALTWEVRSTGANVDVDRLVTLRVSDVPRFFLAAFADQGLQMRGGNGADSYNSTTWDTGNGIVGSNESILFNGASTQVDGVHLYNWENNPDFNRCEHRSPPSPDSDNCSDVLTLPDAEPPSARIDHKLEVGDPQLEVEFITEQLNVCGRDTLIDFTASTYNTPPASGNNNVAVVGTGVGTLTNPEILCFDNVTINRDLRVEPNGVVHFYIAGDLSFGAPPRNDVQVNCTVPCDPDDEPFALDSTRLSFFVEGDEDEALTSTVGFGNRSAIVAGIYAPRSFCEGNPSNAQTDIYGSLICLTISNQGGWRFHFDERLLEIGIGLYQAFDWREELAAG